MSSTSPYPVKYASVRRDCCMSVRTEAKGRVAWAIEMASPASPRDGLLVLGNTVIRTTPDGIVCFASDGKELWKRRTRTGSPVAAANGLLYYGNQMNYLEAVTGENRLQLEPVHIPDLPSEEYIMTLLWPRGEDFVTATYMPEPTYDTEDPDEEPPSPVVMIGRTVYGQMTSEWGGEFEGEQPLPPIYIPALDHCVIATDQVVSVNMKTEQETARFALPIDDPVNWSADPEGTLCITGYEEEHKVLLAMSLAGEEKWRWVDREKDDRWVSAQPPIRSEGQRVYVLTSTRVLAVEQGNLLWEYEVEDQILRHGSSLADGSLLVTAGKTLIHLDRDGRQLFSVSLENEILTPPVVDADLEQVVAKAGLT